MRKLSYSRLIILLIIGLYSTNLLIAGNTIYTVMSFNIRYDNKHDTPHHWTARRDSLSTVMMQQKADIIGMQEVLHNQLTDLKERLSGYKVIGVGRLDGITKGEYAPLWYAESRFDIIKSGYFWLSEKPNTAGSKGWDAACERIATWAILRDKSDLQELFVLNTHLDHEGQIARRESEKLLIKKIKQFAKNRPIIVMGDFNASPQDVVVQCFLQDTHLKLNDSHNAKTVSSGADWTFHDFGKLPLSRRERIDYILSSEHFTTEAYQTIRTDGPYLCLSDHNGVVAKISLLNKANKQDNKYISQRPLANLRKVQFGVIDSLIQKVSSEITDPKLSQMFANCFPNTLDTTIAEQENKDGKPFTFVITGDIHAMWLRDSGAQVWPYLPYTRSNKELQRLIAGVINQQIQYLLIDPYANAFNSKPISSYWAKTDKTQWMHPLLHERKWELDSHCYPIRLSYGYWKATQDSSIFDKDWLQAAKLILNIMQEQQRKDGNGPYTFRRKDDRPTDSQINNGIGAPVKPCGLIFSAFRASDDATQYGFHIPSNMFAVVSLREMAEIISQVYNNRELAERCLSLAQEIDDAIQRYGIGNHPTSGKIYAYEVDGFGNALYMDDANIPSLLSAPYLGYCNEQDPTYLNTRKFLWSTANPYFFKGKAGEGIGGPHVGINQVWPMSIIMRAMTSTEKSEIEECLKLLCNTDANTGFMHESFDADNANHYTRPWFAWANTLFGELLLHIREKHPDLLSKTYSK